jgi:hypothetical protein
VVNQTMPGAGAQAMPLPEERKAPDRKGWREVE